MPGPGDSWAFIRDLRCRGPCQPTVDSGTVRSGLIRPNQGFDRYSTDLWRLTSAVLVSITAGWKFDRILADLDG